MEKSRGGAPLEGVRRERRTSMDSDCSGLSSDFLALKMCGIPVEGVFISEIDSSKLAMSKTMHARFGCSPKVTGNIDAGDSMPTLLQCWKKGSSDSYIEICGAATSQSLGAGKCERAVSFSEQANPGQDGDGPPQLLLMQCGSREHNESWLAAEQREAVLGCRAEKGW